MQCDFWFPRSLLMSLTLSRASISATCTTWHASYRESQSLPWHTRKDQGSANVECHPSRKERENQFQKDRPEEVIISDEYKWYCEKLNKRLAEFSNLWYVHLGLVLRANNQIRLTSKNMKSVRSTPFQAAPISLQFAATEIDKQFKQIVIEAATIEWTAG